MFPLKFNRIMIFHPICISHLTGERFNFTNLGLESVCKKSCFLNCKENISRTCTFLLSVWSMALDTETSATTWPSAFVSETVSVCVTEPFTALVVSAAPTQNQMMLMENPNHLAIQTHPLFLRHPNSQSWLFRATILADYTLVRTI